MSSRFKILFVALLVLPAFVKGQLMDTIAYSLQQKPKFFFNLTTFSSVVSGELVGFGGFRAGLNYNKRVKFGAGFYDLSSRVVSTIHVNDDPAYDAEAQLKLDFFFLTAEYIFFHRYPWQFSFIPFQLSLGSGYYEYYTQPENVRTETEKKSIVLYEPNIQGQFSIFRWIGIGTSIGYRFRLYSDRELKEDLSAPTINLGLRLFVDELFKMAFPNGLCKKKKEEPKPSDN